MIKQLVGLLKESAGYAHNYKEMAKLLIEQGVTVVPCKIGQTAWAIRNHGSKLKAVMGVISEMYFCNDMSIQIVVKNVARGKFGKDVFLTENDCNKALQERGVQL
jgi:hypothetical protein